MNYKIEYVKSLSVIHVTYNGSVSLNERKQVVNEVCARFSAQKPFKILVNVCELKMDLSLHEQQDFGHYLAFHPELTNAKVAVVHKADYNPNLLIDTCAFNNGYRLAEFNQIKEAQAWLTEA